MKELALFQYNEDELKKAKRQLTRLTDRLGIAINNEILIINFSFKEPNYWSKPQSVFNNDKLLTLLQAEFENFYDKTQIFIKDDKDSKNNYIAVLIDVYNKIADNNYIQPINWNKVVIGNIEYEEKSCDGTAESRQNNLAIKLPEIGCSYEEMKKDIKDLLCSSVEAKYKLEESDKPVDTRTSIIYLMKCNNSDCDRKLYIGLTQRKGDTFQRTY